MRLSTGTEVELYLIRHGLTKGNLEHRYVGITEEELCEEGRKGLQGLYIENVDCLFVSPRIRCIQTAGILFPGIGYEIVPEFSEMNFGDYEMKNYEDLKENPYYQKWIDSYGSLPFPNGESREMFVRRTLAGFEKCKKKLESEDRIRKAAFVVHGGTIMAIASSVLGGDYFDYSVENGAYIRL